MPMWTKHLEQADKVLLWQSQDTSGIPQVTNQVSEVDPVRAQGITHIALQTSFFRTHKTSDNAPQRRAH